MSDQGTRALAAMTRLRVALEHTSAALARPDLDALLAGESAIEMALTELPAMDSGARLSRDEERAVRAEVEAAQDALRRCRRLGRALEQFVRTSLEVQGHAG